MPLLKGFSANVPGLILTAAGDADVPPRKALFYLRHSSEHQIIRRAQGRDGQFGPIIEPHTNPVTAGQFAAG